MRASGEREVRAGGRDALRALAIALLTAADTGRFFGKRDATAPLLSPRLGTRGNGLSREHSFFVAKKSSGPTRLGPAGARSTARF